jgi:hypothetical protein
MLRSALSPTSAYVSAGNRASSRERPVNAKRRRTRTKRKVCLQASSSLAPSRSLSSRAGIPWGRELTKQTIEHSAVECPYLPITWETSSAHSNRRSGCGHLALACDDNEPASASNRCARSSRIRPANDRETSRSDGNGWSIESAGQEPDSAIAAGSEIGPEKHSQGGDTGSNPVGTTNGEPCWEASAKPVARRPAWGTTIRTGSGLLATAEMQRITSSFSPRIEERFRWSATVRAVLVTEHSGASVAVRRKQRKCRS